jgi:hypothetical protein
LKVFKEMKTYHTTLVVLFIALVVRFKVEIGAALIASYMQLSLYYNCNFFISLFFPGFSAATDPRLPTLDFGESNLLQLKLIYVGRYIFKDQFFMQEQSDRLLKNIERRLNSQFKRENWNEHTFASIPVPEVTWSENLSPDDVFKEYVKLGVPFIMRNYTSVAAQRWSPQFFADYAGDHELDVVNTSAVSTLRMTLSQFVSSQVSCQDICSFISIIISFGFIARSKQRRRVVYSSI